MHKHIMETHIRRICYTILRAYRENENKYTWWTNEWHLLYLVNTILHRSIFIYIYAHTHTRSHGLSIRWFSVSKHEHTQEVEVGREERERGLFI